MPAAPPKTSTARAARTARPLADALAGAAWAEADIALAEAIAEFEALQAAGNAAARKEAILLLGQALRRAARRRGLDWKPGEGVRRGEALLARARNATGVRENE